MNSPIPALLPIPLESVSAEVIFAPLHDPAIAPTLGLTFRPLRARGAKGSHNWCWYSISWEAAQAGEPAAELTVPVQKPDSRFDQLILCVTAPRGVQISAEACLDGHWRPVLAPVAGTSSRAELGAPLPEGELTEVRLTLTPDTPGPASVNVHWLGLADTALLKQAERGRLSWDRSWPGMLVPSPAADPARFAADLLLSATDLPALRQKKLLPGWREHFALLEKRASKAMQNAPEDQLTEYAPFSDERYIRAREQGRWNYYLEGPLVAFVGLVNQDEAMLGWAARTLLCMVHTTFWCQSAESRLRGSTWDQRCFVEEEMTGAVALMADWLDFLLTDRARDLIRHAVWDKGLAVIERDMMKCEYVHHMNQGPWFCRARILGGLLLEKSWPRMGDYVDRALREMREGMDRYVLADGGTDEGLGYWSLTMHMVLQGLLAYARSRNADVRTILPLHQPQSERFLAVMSAMQPGRVLMDGDNSTDYLVGDTIPILAGLFPGSTYEGIVAECLLRERPFTYFNHYIVDGLFAFILGPGTLPPARCVVPVFGRLEETGHLTSLRRSGGRATRLHVSGCKARPSHSHFDKSGFTLEVDGLPVLIDRGVVRYDDPRGGTMNWSSMHNVITPVLPDGSFGKQGKPQSAILPDGHGDETELHVRVDVSSLWQPWMKRCTRRIDSDHPDRFTVTDAGELSAPGLVAFHLHAPVPFEIEGRAAIVKIGEILLRIALDWADSVTQSEDGIDFKFEPVHHLVARSREVTDFEFHTHFERL
jgi:hypothetical protein